MAYGHKTEHRLRVRAQVVLHAAHGRSNARIAQETGLHLDTVRRWRGRFAEQGLPGLKGRQRCCRPPVFTPLQVAEVKPLARRLPTESGVPLSRWSCPELACEATRRGIVSELPKTATTPQHSRSSASSPPRPGRSAGQTRPAHRRSSRRILRRAGGVISPRRIYALDP
jgi:transposase